jgi:metallo-beta-lactamase superfamily protein
MARTAKKTRKTGSTRRKAPTRKAPARRPVAPAAQSANAPGPQSAAAAAGDHRARIRMYRQGLGDCFLIFLPRKTPKNGRSDYVIMIDCGVILGTSNPEDIMTKVVNDIVAATNGEIDLLLATHEHWDHVSGFVQAADAFKNLKVNEVWLAWTEDPDDALANQLRQSRDNALSALRLGAARLQLGGDPQADEIAGLLEFFGAAKGASTGDALATVKKMVAKPRYCLPGDPPVALADVGVTLYVLGPPHDEKSLRRINPSRAHPETYGLALGGLDMFLDGPGSALTDDDQERPFSTLFEIPLPIAREMDFFKQRYFRPGTADQDWRQIDTAWLLGSAELALQLDSLTNNTSLVLAIELPNKDVLLFVADAQVGNWLSWQDLKWTLDDGRTVTGPDLLRNAIFYKVGHHGSHNATLQTLGLEMMEKLRVAMIPVDEAMAKKKRWNQMPLGDLVTALEQRAKGAVIRVDQPLPASTERLTAQPLYYEVTL